MTMARPPLGFISRGCCNEHEMTHAIHSAKPRSKEKIASEAGGVGVDLDDFLVEQERTVD